MENRESNGTVPNYVTILTSRIVEKFFTRLNLIDHQIEELLIVSPVLGTLSGTGVTLEQLRRILRVRRIHTYLITQGPDSEFTKNAPGHRQALDMLKELDYLEIRHNNSLHAKAYVCVSKQRENSFALLGSANMTKTSIEKNIEIGVLIRYVADGRKLIEEIQNWIKNNLRVREDSRLAKAMERISDPNIRRIK